LYSLNGRQLPQPSGEAGLIKDAGQDGQRKFRTFHYGTFERSRLAFRPRLGDVDIVDELAGAPHRKLFPAGLVAGLVALHLTIASLGAEDVMIEPTVLDSDFRLMRRCIELSKTATFDGEFPFACVIAKGGEIVAEATNRVARNEDITRHAELLAISVAQETLGKGKLAGCTLYSNVEPCAMCSFPIRESRISRVAFSIPSPFMGGFSKWPILADREISTTMPEVFGDPPEVMAGLLRRDAERVWRNWSPLIWGIIKYRGCFGNQNAPSIDGPSRPPEGVAAARRQARLWQRLAPWPCLKI
jgi:tRNA(adenine34) deaminase